MTASPPKVNGTARPPAVPVLGDWQPIEATPTNQAETPTETQPAAQVDNELVAQAQAEAIRAAAWAESEERRLAAEAKKEADLKLAEAEAEAIRVRAEEEARKTRLANDRVERKAREDDAASRARIAESNQREEEANRAREQASRQADAQQKAEVQAAAEVAEAEDRWRGYARSFYIVCAIVALPVQVAAFYNPKALWLMAAPLMLEGGAWVVLKGAAAAVAGHRPHWHYRLIAWLLAFIAAGINLWHGLNAFDPATAIGTAFASIAGPGVWDLHEHGRIRKRDGKPSWRERRAQRNTQRAEAARKAAEEKRKAVEKEAADKAAALAAEQLAAARAEEFPKVWEHACRLAAALGETTVTEAVWRRAHLDIEGTDPGESAEVIRARNAAAKRVDAARQNKPVNTVSKTVNAQRTSQMPTTKKQRVYNPPARPGRRTKGDTAPYVAAARKQASITAKNSRPNAS
jgi:chemotaxis protein histidine kinase CheA